MLPKALSVAEVEHVLSAAIRERCAGNGANARRAAPLAWLAALDGDSRSLIAAHAFGVSWSALSARFGFGCPEEILKRAHSDAIATIAGQLASQPKAPMRVGDASVARLL